LDRIKIDRAFMSEVATEPNAAAVVHGILNLAQSLGLGCVAEGIENNEQLDYLKQQICADMQGFLFSRPLAAEDVSRVLAEVMGPKPLVDDQ
jgi:EAL domain-containing protein (putative c-di-GMP-specific phosphodiesterase class I)